VGRDEEGSAMHECTHAFFDLQSIDVGATEEEAISYVVGALYERMTGLPKSRWGTDQVFQTSHVVAGGLLHQYQLGDVAIPKVDDTAFKTLVLALLSGQRANRFSWLAGMALSHLVASDESAVWIGIFSNIVTERTCSNV